MTDSAPDVGDAIYGSRPEAVAALNETAAGGMRAAAAGERVPREVSILMKAVEGTARK